MSGCNASTPGVGISMPRPNMPSTFVTWATPDAASRWPNAGFRLPTGSGPARPAPPIVRASPVMSERSASGEPVAWLST